MTEWVLVIHVRSREEWDLVTSIYKISWVGTYIRETAFEDYGDKVCIRVYVNSSEDAGYASVGYFQTNGYEIKSFEELFKIPDKITFL